MVAVALTGKLADQRDTTVACTLRPDGLRDRIDTWNRILHDKTALLDAATTRIAITDGIRLEFAPGVDLAELTQLAAAEQDCCRFFHFAITIDNRGIGLDITAPPDANAALTAPFGAPDEP